MAYASVTLCLLALYTRIAKYYSVEPIALAEVKVLTMTTHRNVVSVFISYANADEPLLHELETHLSSLKQQELISTWHKRQVVPGTNWSEAIDEHLSNASRILLLVSSDFLASEYCYGTEMKLAMKRHHAREARVIPILLRPADWQSTPFGKLQALPSNGKPVTSWPDRDEAFVDITKGIRSALEEVPYPVTSIASNVLPRIWNIFYPRNPVFTDREEILSDIHTYLQAGQATALSQPRAINGLGGIGKTQIALEYAYRHAQDYQIILWVLADTRESLASGYIAVAGLLNLPEKDDPDQSVIVKSIVLWLATHTEWLLILDNADDLTMAREFLPPRVGGHLLLTTRAQATGPRVHPVKVEIMQQDTGALFLLRRAKLLVSDALLQDASPSDIATAREICEELGGLPLALDQAGAYMEETPCSLKDYLCLYRMRRKEMLKVRGDLVDDHPESVATTWLLCFEKVEQKDPAAAELLRFCAFLHPGAIPEEILTSGAKHLGSVLQPVASDSLLLDKAIRVLSSYSLISRDTKEQTLTIHRLVQAVLKDAMNMATQWDWTQRVVLAVSEAFPEEVEFSKWTQCERCLPHALVCAEFIEQGSLMLLEAASLLNATGRYLRDRGRYREAEPLFVRALAICEWRLGSENSDTAKILRNQAILYRLQGKYKEAERLCQRALTIFEQQLEASPADTAMSLAILAEIYIVQRRYTEAGPLLQRALTLFEQRLGRFHPHTASCLDDLALLHKTQGKYLEAELLHQRSLEIHEQTLGADHPNTATNLNNLALLYRTQGKNSEAELLYQRALSIYERQLGKVHPLTALSLNNLANLYRLQGRYAEAEPLHVRALEIYEMQLGETHPSTVMSLNNLALLYLDQRRYSEAEPLFSRALIICEQALGEAHPETIQSAGCLAFLYLQQKQYEKAEPLYKRTFSNLQQTLGLGHPATQGVRRQYALILRAMERNDEATSLEKQGDLPL